MGWGFGAAPAPPLPTQAGMPPESPPPRLFDLTPRHREGSLAPERAKLRGKCRGLLPRCRDAAAMKG